MVSHDKTLQWPHEQIEKAIRTTMLLCVAGEINTRESRQDARVNAHARSIVTGLKFEIDVHGVLKGKGPSTSWPCKGTSSWPSYVCV
jgi:hypothetical protein